MPRLTLKQTFARYPLVQHATQLDPRILPLLQRAEQYTNIARRWSEYERIKQDGFLLVGGGAYHHALQGSQYYDAFTLAIDMLLPDVDDEVPTEDEDNIA